MAVPSFKRVLERDPTPQSRTRGRPDAGKVEDKVEGWIKKVKNTLIFEFLPTLLISGFSNPNLHDRDFSLTGPKAITETTEGLTSWNSELQE